VAEFIRPELRAALWRYREAIAGAVIALLGLRWAWGAGDVILVAALLVTAFGAAVGWTGLQRARFRATSGGAGVVTVDEAQVAYFGPYTGGVVSVRQLIRVELDGQRPGHPEWLLTEPGQAALAIPLDAEGAGALFDVFAALDGLDTERMLALQEAPPRAISLIWRAPLHRLN
jgi:hypothetical protein